VVAGTEGGYMTDPRTVVEQSDKATAEHDVDAFMALVAEDAVFRGPGGVDGHEVSGHAAIRAMAEAFELAYPDMQVEVHRRYVDGDTVITEVRSTATQSGPLTLATGERVEATGRTLRERGVYIDRVVDGKIVEETAYYDRHTVLEQLGQLPTG
jgi:steroid delta-isomerase-like uncharacterized protein